MYLRESKQTRADGSVVTYLQLAENVWDAAKGRSQARIVHNCGRSDDAEVVERLRRLAKSILRRCSPDEIVGAACGDTWRNIRDDLKRIQLAQLSSPNGRVWQVTEPTPQAANRLKSLKIKPPKPILTLD